MISVLLMIMVIEVSVFERLCRKSVWMFMLFFCMDQVSVVVRVLIMSVMLLRIMMV